MGCKDTEKRYLRVMADYAASGWAAACLDHFKDGSESELYPFHEEAERYIAGVEDIMEWAGERWSGENLVLSWVSHGTTWPLVAMARRDVNWEGDRVTAGCFFDGSSNQVESAEFEKHRKDGGECMIYGREESRCCEESVDYDVGSSEDAGVDTVVGVDVGEAFSLKTWKITGCGSNLDVCWATFFRCSGSDNSVMT